MTRRIQHRLLRLTAWSVLLLALAAPAAPGAADTITNSIGMTFVRIRGGSFMMGSPITEANRDASEIRHQVVLTEDFYMQTTEVTLGQWQAVMGKSFFSSRKGGGDTPVTRVSWFDAQDFIKKLNRMGDGTYRLPTEAEWEYAARAGTTTPYSWGDEINCSNAMYSNNPVKSEDCIKVVRAKGLDVGQPAPVMQYAPNAWGIYDMAGNVWEWVEDWYAPYDNEKVVNPIGRHVGEMRVKRGGSWFKYGYYCRSANRAASNPASKLVTTGFRVVRTDTAD